MLPRLNGGKASYLHLREEECVCACQLQTHVLRSLFRVDGDRAIIHVESVSGGDGGGGCGGGCGGDDDDDNTNMNNKSTCMVYAASKLDHLEERPVSEGE